MSNLVLNKLSVRAGIATIGIIGGFVSGYGVLVPFYINKFNLDIEIGGRCRRAGFPAGSGCRGCWRIRAS